MGFLELLKAFNEQFGEEINLLIDEGNQLLKIFVGFITTMWTKMAIKKNTGTKDSLMMKLKTTYFVFRTS